MSTILKRIYDFWPVCLLLFVFLILYFYYQVIVLQKENGPKVVIDPKAFHSIRNLSFQFHKDKNFPYIFKAQRGEAKIQSNQRWEVQGIMIVLSMNKRNLVIEGAEGFLDMRNRTFSITSDYNIKFENYLAKGREGLSYNYTTNEIQSSGMVEIFSKDIALKGDNFVMNLNNQSIVLKNNVDVKIVLNKERAQITAQQFLYFFRDKLNFFGDVKIVSKTYSGRSRNAEIVLQPNIRYSLSGDVDLKFLNHKLKGEKIIFFPKNYQFQLKKTDIIFE